MYTSYYKQFSFSYSRKLFKGVSPGYGIGLVTGLCLIWNGRQNNSILNFNNNIVKEQKNEVNLYTFTAFQVR